MNDPQPLTEALKDIGILLRTMAAIEAQEQRINELLATISQRDQRIAELEQKLLQRDAFLTASLGGNDLGIDLNTLSAEDGRTAFRNTSVMFDNECYLHAKVARLERIEAIVKELLSRNYTAHAMVAALRDALKKDGE